MGKASKVLNPADKARKEARKKELKKNKKQRQQVRSAAIESKDPEQVIAELEKIDKLEFDVETNPTFSDSFYKDKRKRLKEILVKILYHYEKEDKDKFDKLKKLEFEYETRHLKVSKEFAAIKAAQEVKIEDIFLPPDQEETNITCTLDDIADDDPLLSESVYVTPLTEGLKPPGCPPGLPPDLNSIVDSIKMAASLSFKLPASIPSHLMNLHLPTTKSRSFKRTITTRQYESNKKQTTSRTYNSTKSPQLNKNIIKAAVIESKPILLKSNQTKFVPSSVISKIKSNKKNTP